MVWRGHRQTRTLRVFNLWFDVGGVGDKLILWNKLSEDDCLFYNRISLWEHMGEEGNISLYYEGTTISTPHIKLVNNIQRLTLPIIPFHPLDFFFTALRLMDS